MTDKKKHWWLYVLKLEQGKYYVGITSQTPEKRMREHMLGIRQARWAKKYKPIGILDQKDLGYTTRTEAEAYENKVTRIYIKERGVNNVRGGDLTQKEDYIVRFGYIFDRLSWEALTVILLLLLIISILTIKLYS